MRVLLIADDGSRELSELEEMVRNVNATEVAPPDKLSDAVYHYDSEARIFENARSFEVREADRTEAILADAPFPASIYLAEGRQDAQEPTAQPEKITALLVEPNQQPRVVEIGTELADLQRAVDGPIEVVYPFEDEVALIVNEEGKIDGLPLNRAIRDEKDAIVDIIAGSFLVTGLGEENFASLPQEMINKYEEHFRHPEVFLKMGSSIMAFPVPDEKAGEKAEMTKPRAKSAGHDEH